MLESERSARASACILKYMVNKPLPVNDLTEVVSQARVSFEALRGARLFVTGGTGFFGHCLLESLLAANRQMNLGVCATVLTRDAARFEAQSPWIAENASLTLLEGDVRSFRFPAGDYTHVVHAATDSGGCQSAQTPASLTAAIIAGTERVLEFAQKTRSKRLLYVSSGAVYGRSTSIAQTPETHPIPELPTDSYEAAKLAAERLCLASPIETVIARCFAFVGPRLPLDQHFAIGNFIGAALAGRALEVTGDGSPRRSWMYMSDLAVWLWTLLAQGQPGRAYNVGSDAGYSIAEAAKLVAATLAPELPVSVAEVPVAGAAVNSYVPSLERARVELGLRVSVPLDEALRRTAAWYR
jgi:dTDP-glucose 4,6-dehydratase